MYTLARVRDSNPEVSTSRRAGVLITNYYCEEMIYMRTTKTVLLTIITITISLCSGCLFPGAPLSSLDPHCQEWLDQDVRLIRFYDRPAARALPLETQLAMYTCGRHRVHPSSAYIDKAIIERGTEAASFFKKKLSTTTDPRTIGDIVRITSYMQLYGTYECVDDPEIIVFIHNALSRVPPIDRWEADEILPSLQFPSQMAASACESTCPECAGWVSRFLSENRETLFAEYRQFTPEKQMKILACYRHAYGRYAAKMGDYPDRRGG